MHRALPQNKTKAPSRSSLHFDRNAVVINH